MSNPTALERVTRYRCFYWDLDQDMVAESEPSPTGNWVRYDDYQRTLSAALQYQHELEEARSSLAQLREKLQGTVGNDYARDVDSIMAGLTSERADVQRASNTTLAETLHRFGLADWVQRADQREMLRVAQACVDALDEIQRLEQVRAPETRAERPSHSHTALLAEFDKALTTGKATFADMELADRLVSAIEGYAPRAPETKTDPTGYGCPACARPYDMSEDASDVRRFAWLTEDLGGNERQHRNALLERMAVMSRSTMRRDIDLTMTAFAAQSSKKTSGEPT